MRLVVGVIDECGSEVSDAGRSGGADGGRFDQARVARAAQRVVGYGCGIVVSARAILIVA
jgi:hypothetical protein